MCCLCDLISFETFVFMYNSVRFFLYSSSELLLSSIRVFVQLVPWFERYLIPYVSMREWVDMKLL